MTAETSRPDAAIDNLTHHQEQCDMDGVMVKVSRQALDEVLAHLRGVAQAAPIPLAWRYELAHARFWPDDKTAGEYTDWRWRVSETMPHAGDAMRNLTPLYALPSTLRQCPICARRVASPCETLAIATACPLSSTNHSGEA